MNLLFQFPVGGADHPHFHFLVFLGADAAELAVLKQLQQLRLQGHVEFGNFVEKQRSAMRHFDAPGLHSVSAGEGSLFVAEEFALQQRARNRRTIHLHPWAGLPRRSRVNHARDNIFSRTALSLNQHRDVRARDFFQTLAQRAHGLRTAKND